MNLKVQNQIPNNREGAKGEVRLITRGRTAFLYIKGINQWYVLGLTPSARSRIETTGDKQTVKADERLTYLTG